jgi:hypothetical protein
MSTNNRLPGMMLQMLVSGRYKLSCPVKLSSLAITSPY